MTFHALQDCRVSVREDRKNYTNLFSVYDDVQDHIGNDSRRRSVRTRKPPTRFANATTSPSREDVLADTSASKLESSDVENTGSLFEEKHEEGREEVHKDEHEDEHQDEPEMGHEAAHEKRNDDKHRD